MKVVLAISETPPMLSGIARTAGRLHDAWVAAGHDVSVVSVADTGRGSLGEFRVTGLVPRWPSLRKRFDGADLISLHGPAPTFSDALLPLLWLRRRHGTKLVYTHHFDMDFPKLGLVCGVYNWMNHRLARLADHIVVTTPAYSSLVGAPHKTTVIPWGADGAEAGVMEAKGQPYTVLFVGQLRPYKGVDVLIRAAARVPSARVLVVGRGPERANLEELANDLGASNVYFMGPMIDAEIRQLYRESHVIVLPSVSRLEAFGITLVEGMASGCVPVAASLPGVADVVGDAGFTFPVRNADALAAVLGQLSDADDRRRHALRALERSRAFTWQRTFDDYLRLFESLIGAGEVRAVGAAL